MADAVDLLRLIKRAAIQAIKAEKLVEVIFGKVTEISPLKIYIDQKMTLGKAQLILTRNVTDHPGVIERENGMQEHITVKNALVVGDEVLLLRQQGGQKYVVWDRVNET